MSAREVIDKLARGDVFLRPITFPEGLTIQQMAQIYERDGGGGRADFVAAARNAALIRDIDPAAPDLEGYLFPNTYSLPRRITAEQLVQQMVTAFRDVLTQEIVQRAADAGPDGSPADRRWRRSSRRRRPSRKSGRSWRPSTPTACASAWACSATRR